MHISDSLRYLINLYLSSIFLAGNIEVIIQFFFAAKIHNSLSYRKYIGKDPISKRKTRIFFIFCSDKDSKGTVVNSVAPLWMVDHRNKSAVPLIWFIGTFLFVAVFIWAFVICVLWKPACLCGLCVHVCVRRTGFMWAFMFMFVFMKLCSM